MPYATRSDVEIDYGQSLGDDEDTDDRVETLLERAELIILQHFPDLDDRIADGRSPLLLVKQVEVEMVLGVLRNPNGWQSQSQTVGGLSQSYTINVAVASGLLRFTEDQQLLVSGANPEGSSAMGSFAPLLSVPPPAAYAHPPVLGNAWSDWWGWQ